MPNTVLGKVSVVPRGDYNASTTYYALDIVGYNGGSYLAMQQVTGVTPSNDGVNWMQLSGPGLPGKQGPQGVPGAAAGFGEATATVDDTSGTPSVEVETSGPDTAKVFTFKFYGLKGTKGDTGDKGNTGNTGPVGPQGVSVVTAQINEQGHLIITLSEGEPIDAGDATGPIGPQGIQGEAGESVGSIQRTSGTGAPGTTDTYTMYSTDGSEIGTFTVYNGTNGTGAGDFMADGSVPMTGALDMGGQKVTNVGAPTAPTDAVRQSDLEAISDEIDHILDGTTPVTVPVATEIKAGIVKPGEGMSVTEDGTLNVDDQLPAGGQTGQVLTKTESGEAWQDAPDGLPAGGETGQVLTKTAEGSAWEDAPSGLPDGGVEGQMLYKSADGAVWGDKPVMWVRIARDTGNTTADKTFTEIKAAYDSGAYVCAYIGSGWDYPGALQLTTIGTSYADFSAAGGGTYARVEDDDVWTVGFVDLINKDQLNTAIDALKPNRLTAVLSASGWSGNSQTITVNGVITDTSAQDIDISCADKASADAWAAGGVWCSNPTTANQLTFTCTTPPTANINLNIRLWEVG